MALLFLVLIPVFAFGQDSGCPVIDPIPPNEEGRQPPVWEDLLMREPTWYGSAESQRAAENVLIYQRDSGGWPKNITMSAKLDDKKKKELLEFTHDPMSTIDNSATTTQLYFLARMIQTTRDQRYILAFLKGLDYLLDAQYANGGWPQYYPLRKGYYSHITYNDEAMISVMRLLRDVAQNPAFSFVDQKRRSRAGKAVQKGIDCILKTQITVHGELTAWCAQHDEITLKPAKARAYEHPSLSGKESVGIVRFLMSLDHPSPEIVASVQRAVAWLNRVKMTGIRVIRKSDAQSPTGFDKVVVHDASAPPMWARFYDIGTYAPIFSDRDSKIYRNLSEISSERRNEYGWLGYWPDHLLNKEYILWQAKWAPDHKDLLR